MKKSSLSFAAAFTWLLLSVFLLTLPGSNIPKEDWLDKLWVDKWVHIVMFGTLAFLWCWAFIQRSPHRSLHKNTFIFIGVACLAYGVGMEFVQKYLVSNRSFDIGDIIADGVGSALGTWFIIRRYIKK